VVLGCGKSSTEAEAAKTIGSWNATLRLVDQAEARGAVPTGFGRQVREAAVQGRARAQAKLEPAPIRTP
jgi:hypothetical protein